jgi:hypothetical protein
MAVKLKFHFPVEALILNAGYILPTVGKYRTILGERVDDDDIATATTLWKGLKGDVATQKGKVADTGTLTKEQNALLKTLKDWMGRVRRTAPKAFPDDSVKLHSEFQVGVEKDKLGAILESAGIMAAACAKTENIPALKKQGWIKADTDAFVKVIDDLTATDTTQETSKTFGPAATDARNTDANQLYDLVIGFQNAGNLQYPASDPANAPVRTEFRLGLFPPQNEGGKGKDKPQPPAPTK